MTEIEQLTVRKTLLSSGDVLQSRYRILRQLGHGGFSRTYLAEDINRFNECCVLKEFAPQLKGTFALKKAQELFEREAGVLYRLQHPLIPRFRQLFRHKQEGEGYLFLVQDYIEGQTYHALLNQRLEAGEKFSETEISLLLSQILPILEYIHSMGVIHRDISPDNLILHSVSGLPVLIDFGCIKEVEHKTQSELKLVASTLPLIGTAIGKTGYAPPEQTANGIVFAHSDLYALAATAVVLLTGKEPQQLIEPLSYRWHWQEKVTLDPKLEWVLSTMLAPQPSDRFGSASEVINTLRDISVVEAKPQSSRETEHNFLNWSNIAQICLVPLKSANPSDFSLRLLTKLLFCISLTAILILGGLWLRSRSLDVAPAAVDSVAVDARLRERFSYGYRVLVWQTTTPEKELAVAAYAQGDYDRAIALFSASLQTLANDPESLIYLNNALVGNNKAYSIAVSVPIGSDVNAAQEILRGVAQAQTAFNRSLNSDRLPLRVQIINDDNEPEIARQVAQSLSRDREILGVVGHYASDVTLATAKIYQTGRLVAISPISTSVKLSNLSPYLFRTVPSDYLAARALAEYMLEESQQTRAAVFYNSQSNYSESLKSEFVSAVTLGGGQIVNTFDLADANFNAAESWQQAADGGAEVIMLAANTGTLDKALQVVQVNRQRLSLLGGDDVYTPKTLQVAGEAAAGMVLAIPWHIQSNTNAKFVRISRNLWGGEVNWRTAMAYDATKALIAAIARHPTRVGIQKVLADPNFNVSGAGGRVRFAPSGDRLNPIELVKIESSNGNFNYEFTPATNEP